MINPYQAPPEASGSAEHAENPLADFRLSARQIRYAESKFLLHRCGGRLTLASLVMIGLAIVVAFDLPGFPSARNPGAWYQISLVLRELAVMGVAAAVYLGLIRRARRETRAQLRSHGIIEGAEISVRTDHPHLVWTTSGRTLTADLKQIHLINTGKGLIVGIDPDLFLFVPRRAVFPQSSYRGFVRGLRQAMA